MELLQLIREAKYPDRMGIEIPESAKIVLFQEEKLKSYYNELSWASSEYEAALQRHGVQAPLRHGQQRLEQLVTNIYDIIQRRVEKNLRIGSRTLLVDLPADESFTVMDFVAMRKSHIGEKGGILQGKNVEIEHAVDDLVKIIVNYQFDTTTEIVAPEELTDESTEESTGMPTEEPTEEPTDEPTEEPTDEPSLEILMTTTHSAPTRAFMPDTKRRRRRSSATTSSLATYHFQFPLVTTTIMQSSTTAWMRLPTFAHYSTLPRRA